MRGYRVIIIDIHGNTWYGRFDNSMTAEGAEAAADQFRTNDLERIQIETEVGEHLVFNVSNLIGYGVSPR